MHAIGAAFIDFTLFPEVVRVQARALLGRFWAFREYSNLPRSILAEWELGAALTTPTPVRVL